MTANPTRFKASKTLAIRGASIDDSVLQANLKFLRLKRRFRIGLVSNLQIFAFRQVSALHAMCNQFSRDFSMG
jgi:hypothetical protein